MKTKITLLLMLMINVSIYAQQQTIKEEIISKIEKVTTAYEDDLKKNINENKSKDSIKAFNPKMLNMLISKHIGSYYTEASDVSLQKFSASIDTEDNTLDFGLNWDLRNGKETEKLSCLLYTGFSVKSDKNFATIVKNGAFDKKNNLVLKAKATYFFKGSIFYDNKKQVQLYKSKPKIAELSIEDIVKVKRDTLLKNKRGKIKKYIDEEFETEFNDRINTYRYRTLENITLEEDLKEFRNDKFNELYTEIANEEKTYIEDNYLYDAISSKWMSLEVNFPVFKDNYTLVQAITDTLTTKSGYRPFQINGTFSYFKKYRKHWSYYLNAQLSVFNNNSIRANNITANELSAIITQDDGSMLANSANKSTVYVTNGFNEFVTTALKGESIIYFYKNMVGISGAVEFNRGENYNPINWKIGMPISLKDKEGNATVSLELQWKEVNYNHFLGIKAGFNFGKFIN